MEKLSPHCVAWTLLLRCSWVKNNSKKLNPFHSCAGKTSKGREQVKQGYDILAGSGDFGCEEVRSLTDRTWLAKASSTGTLVPAKPVDSGCEVRWGSNTLHWWNLSFSNTLCSPVRNASAVRLSQPSTRKTEMALLRWLQNGVFGTLNVLSD